MCNRAARRSVFCIVPPHVLKSIAERGDADQRRAATNTLSVDATLRAFRASAQTFATAPAAEALASVGEKRRTIFDARSREQLPGRFVRGEGDAPTGDAAVDEAYDGLGDTWDFFFEVYGRRLADWRRPLRAHGSGRRAPIDERAGNGIR